MNVSEIKCKTALSKSRLPGLNYSLNPYRGCIHNCAYCYVPNILRINRSEWGKFVECKINIPNILSKELKKKRKGVVGLSTVTDPYQPIEEKYRLTRYCLEQLLIHDSPVHIQTKSDLILRDIDLLSKFSKIEVMFSIGTINDYERKVLEPNSKPIEKRLKAIKKLSSIDIKTSIFFGPIYPTIKKEELSKYVDIFIKSGVKEIMIDKLNLKPRIHENLILRTKNEDFSDLFSNKKFLLIYYFKLKNDLIEICKNKNARLIEAF